MDKNEIRLDPTLLANLQTPDESKGLIIFAHGSGAAVLSPRNNYVVDILNRRNMTTAERIKEEMKMLQLY